MKETLDIYINTKLVTILRWIILIPVFIFSPIILYKILNLSLIYFSKFYETPQISIIDGLWHDIIVRLATFYIAVKIAPSHKKTVYIIFLAIWSILATSIAILNIILGESIFILLSPISQIIALLIFLKYLKLNK